MSISDQPAIITGTLYNPELKYSAGGLAYCKFSIGKAKRKKNKQTGEFELNGMVFYNCMCFGPEAEQIGQSPDKTTKIQCALEFDQDEYQDRETGQKKRSDKFMVRKLLELAQKKQYQGNQQYNQAQPQNNVPPQNQPPQQNQAPQQQGNAGSMNDFDQDIPFS